MSKRVTRSQTFCLAKPPAITLSVNGKRKTVPLKTYGRHLKEVTNQPALHKSTTKVVSPEINIPLRRSMRIVSRSESSSLEPQPSTNIKGRRTTIHSLKSTAQRKSIRSNPGENNVADVRNDKEVKATTKRQLNSNSSISSATLPNVSQATSILLRRSLRLTSRTESALPDPLPLTIIKQPEALPLATIKRRSTIHSFTAIEDIAPATNLDKNDATDKNNCTDVRNVMKTTSSVSNESQNTAHDVRNVKEVKKTARLQSEPIRTAVVFISFSDDIKKILVDDLRFIKIQKKLYEIPLTLNVAEVAENYVTLNKDDDTAHPTGISLNDLFQGIIEYFDVLIGTQLLYDSEREQYEELLANHPGTAMSKIYPPIYLLRLLVRLNKLLDYKNLDDATWKYSMDWLNKFVAYLSENISLFF